MIHPIHQHERDTASPTRRTKTKQARQSRLAGLVDRLGNRGLQALRARALQRKAEAAGVSMPEDPLEILADRVAEEVVAEPAAAVGPAPPPAGEPVSGTAIQRDALSEAGATHSDSMPGTPGPPAAPRSPRPGGGPSPHGALASELLSGLDAGSLMPRDVRRFMEGRFGRSFAEVRVHTGEQAAKAARSVAAKAFTIGSEVVFGEGRWAPETHEGKRLLAHELAHVVQQEADTGLPAPGSVTEADADRVSHDVAEGRGADVSTRASPGSVQRDPLITREPNSEIYTTYRYGGGEGATSFVLVEGQRVAHIEHQAAKTGQRWDSEWRVLTIIAKADYWDAKAIPSPNAQIAGVNRVIIDVNGNITAVDVLPPEPKPRKPTTPKPEIRVQPRTPKPQPEVRPSIPELEPKPHAPEQQFTPKLPTDAEQAADQVAHLSDSDLSTIGAKERALLLNVFANTHDAIDVRSIVRLLDSTPEDELTELLDELFKDQGAMLQKLTSLVEPGDDAIALAESLTQVWNRSQKLPDEGQPRWRPGLMGPPVKMTRQQYDQMLAIAPRMLTREIEHLEESIRWQEQGRSWRTQGLGTIMGGFVDAWSGAIRPPTALEAIANPSTLFFANPYLQLGFARSRLSTGNIIGAADLLSAAQTQNELLLSMWSQYESATQIGGQAAISDLETVRNVADLTLIALSAGQGAVVLGSLRGMTAAGSRVLLWQAGKGALIGGGFNVARQGVQYLEGSRTEFGTGEFVESTVMGTVLGPAVARNPNLLISLSALGGRSAVDELARGNLGTAAFDAGTALLPHGIRGLRSDAFGQWLRPRVAGLRILAATMRGAGNVEGIGPGPYARASAWQFNQPALQTAGPTKTIPGIPASPAEVSVQPRPTWAPSEISVSPVRPSGTFAGAPQPGTGTGLQHYGITPIFQLVSPSPTSQAASAPRPRTGAEDRFARGTLNTIKNDPNNRLRFLLNEHGDQFQRPPSRRHSTLISVGENVWFVEMGHLESHWAGGPERLALEDAWINQRDRVTAEGGRRAWIHKEAIVIDGVAVEKETALLWEREGKLPPGTVAAAPPSMGQIGERGVLIDWSP